MLTNDIQTVSPAFDKNNIPVVFATDNNFVPYLGVTIKSLVENSSEENNYDIVILFSNVDEYNRKRLKSLEEKNVSIRFYDMTALMEEYKENWYVHWDWSNAIYYRFFVQKIFKDYKKVLYLDGDIIILEDIAKLYNIDLEDNYLGGVQDISQQMSSYVGEKYREKILHIQREKYINTGVLILNIKKLRKIDFTYKCIKALQHFKTPVFPDQDIINFISQNNIKYISHDYNLLWNCIHYYKDAKNRMPHSTYKKYITSWNTPKIIHYAGGYKPWKQPWLYYSEYFWKYARQTVFYEEIIYKNTKNNSSRTIVRNAINRRKIYLQYLRCKLLKLLTFGNTRKHYKEKTDKYKKIVKDYRKTLNG